MVIINEAIFVPLHRYDLFVWMRELVHRENVEGIGQGGPPRRTRSAGLRRVSAVGHSRGPPMLALLAPESNTQEAPTTVPWTGPGTKFKTSCHTLIQTDVKDNVKNSVIEKKKQCATLR